jgi:hypothetical protein
MDKEDAMFVIFGTKIKTSETGHGQFFCPFCKTSRPYVQKESANYFTLYFLPLFKTNTPKIYIECQFCHNVFKTELLTMDAAKLQVSAMIADAEKEIKTGIPSHIIYHKMLAQKIPVNVAKSLSIALLGPNPKICKTCGSLYSGQILSCSNCGGELIYNQDLAFWEQKKAADQLYAQMVKDSQ